MTETVRSLPLAKVRPDPDQPRKKFDEAEIASLAASIRENGLIQPITVRADGRKTWVIVAGERRYRAHLHNQADTILAIVREISGSDLLVAQIIENAQRVDMTPLEEANAYQRLVEELGGDVECAAKKLGKMSWRVTERTCLLKLEAEYQQLLATGNLSSSQAYEMAQLSPLGQHRLFRAIKGGQCPTYNALRAVALALRESEAQTSLLGDAVPAAPTEVEQAAMSRLEKKINAACKVLSAGFDDNEIVATKKIDPGKAAAYAAKLALIRNHLEQIEKALRASAVTRGDLFAA